MKITFLQIIFLLSSLITIHASDANVSKQSTERISVDGLARTYVLYLPADFNTIKNNSLIIALHGRSGSGLEMERLSGFEAIADKEKFIVVYPNGIDRSWNDGRETKAHKEGINDVAFISLLIDEIIAKYNVDKHKIYVTGMSNGAFMSIRLACELSGKIAAIAAVDGTIDTASANYCHPEIPVSIMLIQGTKDPLVPFDGGELKFGAGGTIYSHRQTIKHWLKIDGCNSNPVISNLNDDANDGTRITTTTFENDKNKDEVVSIIVLNGGHTWPGGEPYLPERWIGITSGNMKASEVIWEFFKRH